MGAAAGRYGFADRNDAVAYLGEVARLWGTWVAGMVLLFVLDGTQLVVAALALLVVLFVLLRPLQRRVAALGASDVPDGRGVSAALGRGSDRDRLMREFTYGRSAFSQALELAGLSPSWMWARSAVIGSTLVAFAAVVLREMG